MVSQESTSDDKRTLAKSEKGKGDPKNVCDTEPSEPSGGVIVQQNTPALQPCESEPDGAKERGSASEAMKKGGDNSTDAAPHDEGHGDVLGYSVGTGSGHGGRGDEYSDRFGRGDDASNRSTSAAGVFEREAEPSGYSHSRQTRGISEESARSDDAIAEKDESNHFQSVEGSVTYTVKENADAMDDSTSGYNKTEDASMNPKSVSFSSDNYENSYSQFGDALRPNEDIDTSNVHPERIGQ